MNIREIPVGEIIPNQWNGNRQADDELVDSVAKYGLLQPVSVWKDGIRNAFVCIYGWRRVDAARKAGLKTVPAIVEDSVAPAEARLLTLVENIHREEQNPMTEARVCEYLAKRGMNDAEIARRLGKTPRFVARRLALAGICPQAEMLLEELGHYDVDAVAMLAKCPPSRQMEILERTPYLAGNAREMERAITGKCPLAGAPFDGEDASLVPSAGTCTACKKRTGAQKLLFGGEDMSGNSCLDAECFAAKTAAHVNREIARIRSKHRMAPLVVDKHTYDFAPEAERELYDANGAKPMLDERLATTPEDRARPDARMAIAISGGTVREVLVVPSERKKDGRAAKPKTPEEKAENLRKRRLAWVLDTVRAMLDGYLDDLHNEKAPREASCESLVIDIAEALTGEVLSYQAARRTMAEAIVPLLAAKLATPPLFAMDADKTENAIFHALCLMRDPSEDPDKKLARLKSEAEEKIPE